MDNPTMPGPIESRAAIANIEAKRVTQLPMNSNLTPSHLQLTGEMIHTIAKTFTSNQTIVTLFFKVNDDYIHYLTHKCMKNYSQRFT